MGTAIAATTIFWTPSGGVKTNLSTSLETLSAFIETKAFSTGDSKFSYFIDSIISHITDVEDLSSFVIELYGADRENGPFILLAIVQPQ